MSLKIAQISCVFPPYKGGIGTVAWNYAKYLSSLNNTVTVYTPLYEKNHETANFWFNLQRIKPRLKHGNAAFIPQLLRYLKKNDIIHLHYPFFGGAEIVWLYKMMNPKSKICLTYHMDFIPDTAFKKVLSFHSRPFLKSLIKKSEFITVSSLDYIENSYIKDIYAKYKDKFKELPFGVDEIFWKSQEIISSDNKSNILFVGGLDKAHYFKGLDVLLESLPLLKNDFTLTVVGDGELKKNYLEKTKKLGIENKIIFKGRVTDTELVYEYQKCGFFVLPSINQGEAFGLVFLNAFACKKPVIGSNLPGVRTVIDHGKNGFLVEPENKADLAGKIDYLIENPQICKEFGHNGYLKASEKYQWGKIAQKLESLYKDCL